jgi:hypothetical protein
VIGERQRPEMIALRHREAVVAAPVAQALGEIIGHLRECERHHDELETAGAQRERSDTQCDQHRDRHRAGPDHDGLGDAVDRQHSGRVGADAEQGGLSESDEPGIAEQQVDAERGHAVDCDLGRKARVVGAEIGRHHDRGREQEQEQHAAASEERHAQPRCAANRPVRLNSSTTAIST